jgi:hypothetical protein
MCYLSTIRQYTLVTYVTGFLKLNGTSKLAAILTVIILEPARVNKIATGIRLNSDSMVQVLFPNSKISATRRPCIRSEAVLFIVLPISTVLIAIGIGKDSLAVSFIVDKYTIVTTAIGKSGNSCSMPDSLVKVSLITIPILFENPVAVEFSIFKLTLVLHVSVGPRTDTLSMWQALLEGTSVRAAIWKRKGRAGWMQNFD